MKEARSTSNKSAPLFSLRGILKIFLSSSEGMQEKYLAAVKRIQYMVYMAQCPSNERTCIITDPDLVVSEAAKIFFPPFRFYRLSASVSPSPPPTLLDDTEVRLLQRPQYFHTEWSIGCSSPQAGVCDGTLQVLESAANSSSGHGSGPAVLASVSRLKSHCIIA